MKQLKFWSILMLMVIFTNATFAQTYSLLDIQGEWEIVEHKGKPNGSLEIEKFTSITFELPPSIRTSQNYSCGEMIKSHGYYRYEIKNLFVTHGNLIQFQLVPPNPAYHYYLMLHISSLTSDTMVLESLQNDYSMILKRGSASNIPVIKEKAVNSNDYYNLNGVKVENPKENEIYINNGRKIIK